MIGGAVLIGGELPPPEDTTTGEAPLVAKPEMPPSLIARTFARRVCPTSPATSVYAEATWFARSTQLPPPLSQRCHWYVNPVGLFVQLPVDTVSDAPSWALPPSPGSAVLPGAAVLDAAVVYVTYAFGSSPAKCVIGPNGSLGTSEIWLKSGSPGVRSKLMFAKPML